MATLPGGCGSEGAPNAKTEGLDLDSDSRQRSLTRDRRCRHECDSHRSHALHRRRPSREPCSVMATEDGPHALLALAAEPEPEPEPETTQHGGAFAQQVKEASEASSAAAEDGELLLSITGRYATLGGIRSGGEPVVYTEGRAFDLVSFGSHSSPVQRSTVLLIPGLLSPEECAQLIDDVELGHCAELAQFEKNTRRRVHVPGLSESTQALFDVMLRDRLLPLVSRELPAVEDYMWSRSKQLRNGSCEGSRADMLPPLDTRVEGKPLGSYSYRYNDKEPAINR